MQPRQANAPSPTEVMTETNALRLLEQLSREIISGRIAAGTRLDEKTLAETHHLSRTPVREALTELCARGLALRRPYRGVEVIAPDPAHLAESFEAMSEVEALCAALAAGRMSITQTIVLEDLMTQMAEAQAAGAHETYQQLNFDFHDRICQFSGNGQLAQIARDLRNRFEILRRAQLQRPERIGQSLAEHRQIFAALAERRADSAARLVRAHLRGAMAATLRLRDGADTPD